MRHHQNLLQLPSVKLRGYRFWKGPIGCFVLQCFAILSHFRLVFAEYFFDDLCLF